MPLQQTRVVLANGIELDVVDEGPRDAPVLIFLHGFPEAAGGGSLFARQAGG